MGHFDRLLIGMLLLLPQGIVGRYFPFVNDEKEALNLSHLDTSGSFHSSVRNL